MQNINTILNFGGFYNSIHSVRIDDRIDDNIECFEIDYDNINYTDTFKEYAKDLTKAINKELDINLEFISLNSPREYNFKTDYMEVSLTKKDILKLFKLIKDNDLKQKVYNNIEECTTSRDGYISFYSYSDFFKKDNLDLLTKVLLEVLYNSIEEDISYDFDFEIIEN